MKRIAGCSLLVLGLLLVGMHSKVKAQQNETIYDEEVKLASFEDLDYPKLARVTRVQGVVVIRVEIDEKGNVTGTWPISGSKALIPECLSNAKKWKFKPNSHKGAVIVYEFRMEESACHDRSHSLFLLVHPNFASVTICAPVIE